VIVTPSSGTSEAARTLPLRSLSYARGPAGVADEAERELLHFSVEPSPSADVSGLPALARELPTPDASSATRIDLFFTMNADADGNLAPRIDWAPASDGVHIAARLGERQLWSVSNLTEWDHPFHLHGFFFQVLDVDGVAPSVREWKDTVNVRPGATLRLLVHFDERPGMWMFHCHILDHADHGMMGMVQLR
jgi:FtsP/CotA-like multicopper oxidase with cupredoxin domain